MPSSLEQLADVIFAKGASRLLIKRLANNDNSKNQIYLSSDFDVIRVLPSHKIISDGMSKKGPIFKAALKFLWTDLDGNTEHAKHAQIILYPDYPETRMSGFLKGCPRNSRVVPRHLMQPPTSEERAQRTDLSRFLVLGVNEDTIWAYCTDWESPLSEELHTAVLNNRLTNVATVFYEFLGNKKSSQQKLIEKLTDIYRQGDIESCRLNRHGQKLPYLAQNGAGYTLEAQFGITPNGSSDPDFMDWELKAHSGSVVTLMTPEPNIGTYLDDLEIFLRSYGSSKQPARLDFASRHNVGELNEKTHLTMRLIGYDAKLEKITDPTGGLFLINLSDSVVAGWTFDKIIEHWKKKHANTCYVAYTVSKEDATSYRFGPEIALGKGTGLIQLLNALYNSTIYYDPGINMKLLNGVWKPKKRNQFRVHWKHIGLLYKSVEHIDLSDL